MTYLYIMSWLLWYIENNFSINEATTKLIAEKLFSTNHNQIA